MWSRLRELERQRWKLAQRLEQRPEAEGGRLSKGLERAERDHRELREELEGIAAARKDQGTQPWEVHNLPQNVRELRDSEDRRQQGRDRVEALKLRREELRAELTKLRGDGPVDRSGPGPAGDGESRVTTGRPVRDLEVRYDDRTAAGLRDLKGAQQNVEWMAGELAKEQRGLEQEIGRLESTILKEQERPEKEQKKAEAKEQKGQDKEQKRHEKEQKKAEKAQESQAKKDKTAGHLRSVGAVAGGILAGAAVAVGISAAIDSGSEGGAGDSGSEGGAGDSGSAGVVADPGSAGVVADPGSAGVVADPGSAGVVADPGSAGAVADPAYMGLGGAVPAGVEQGSALGSAPAPTSDPGIGDSSGGVSEENSHPESSSPSRASSGTDRTAPGAPLSGGQGLDPAGLLLPLMLSNLPDSGPADPGPADPGPDESSENDPGRPHDSAPGTQFTPVPPPAQQAVTAQSPRPSADESPVTDPRRQAGETAPQSAAPSSPAAARGDRRSVVYTHAGDGVTETVSASVADAYEKAYSNKSTTDAKAAYAGTDAEWTDEKALEPVDPNDLMSGDVITFDNGSAMVRVQKQEGDPAGGDVDVIIKGELTPIGAVMAEGAEGLGGFAGFVHPPGIELPAPEEPGPGASVPMTGDPPGDTTVPA
jgi:hypothetical protein